MPRQEAHATSMSTYRTIVVDLDPVKRRAERVEIAFGLADAFDAHVVGLHAPGPVYIPSAALAEGTSIIRDMEGRRRKQVAEDAERDFRAVAATRNAEWRHSEQDSLYAMRLSARYADLLVLGQPDPYSRELDDRPPGYAADVVLSAGRPVLFVPYAGRFAKVGGRVLVAWNASREAARAVSDALPFLARAQRVEVVAFDADKGGDHGEAPAHDIALFLARHGVKAIAAEQAGTGLDVGAQILSRAADIEADLIVMGCYGHSRVRELALGGASRTLLESMTVPVLMSH